MYTVCTLYAQPCNWMECNKLLRFAIQLLDIGIKCYFIKCAQQAFMISVKQNWQENPNDFEGSPAVN